MNLDCAGIQSLGESLSGYCDPDVRSVLRALLGSPSPLTTLQIAERSGLKRVDEVLGRLSKVLRVSGVTYRAVASQTGESEFTARLSCPYCGSQDITRDELVEHVACGYVGRLSEFGAAGSLRCPRCKSPVDPAKDLRSIGFWYRCNSCHQAFPRPNFTLVGIRSGAEILPEQLVPVRDVSYEVPEELRGALSGLLDLLDELEASASSSGYRPAGGFRLKGKSGVEHEFCMALDGGGFKVLVDLVLCGDPSRILRHLTKAFDASAEFPVVLLASPDVGDPALRALISAAPPNLRVRVVSSNDPAALPGLLASELEAARGRAMSS